MKRILSLLVAIVATFTVSAQSPEAVRESLGKYPNLAATVLSTYPSIPLGEVATAPEGFEPFYFSLVGRHGSRYDQKIDRFRNALTVFRRADSLGILTADGKVLHKRLQIIYNEQKGRDGELSTLGVKQWQEISRRAYERFGEVFRSGSVEAKSSTSLRCVFSMVTFNDALKGLYPSLTITQNARKMDLGIIRPFVNDPKVSEVERKIVKEYEEDGEWSEERKEWDLSNDVSSFVSKVTTDSETFIQKCCIKSPGSSARYVLTSLVMAENFNAGDRELLTRLFTVDEMYRIYVYNAIGWATVSMGRGNDYAETRQSHMRTLVEDILDKAEAAIEGKNPNVANLRFTHDSYVGPLISTIGYDGCVPQWSKDIEATATSYNHGLVVPMAANLQIVLYRNKRGEVLVRSLLNERDATLPIKCATAPFYPWKDFAKYIRANMNRFDKAAERVMKKHNK
ncbi:MAG: hypothetical protein IKV09_04095 [Alistipes sp.]|nr:hypothetical protein [Alistipes sp.]